MLSASIPAAAPSRTSWTGVRRVVLHPRTFQLRASQGRERPPQYGRVNVYQNRKAIVTTREATTRCLSTQQIPDAPAQVTAVTEETLDPPSKGQSFQSPQNRGLSEAPEKVSPELFAHDPARLLSAVHFKKRHHLETHTKARRKIASQENTLRKVPIRLGNDSHINERLTSSHGYHSLSGRTSDSPGADRHKFSEPLQRNPRTGLEYIDALGQERHGSCALSLQSRFLSSLTDSAIPKGKCKQSLRQKNAPLSSERQVRDFDRQDENLYSAGESSHLVTREKLRHCMRRVPQSVAIITARDLNDPQNAWRGATVSSFTTVTFEPEVIVSLNLKLPSTTYNAILSSNRFNIDMLKANGQGAELASRFASPLEEARKEAFAVEERPQPSALSFHSPFSRSHGVQNPFAFRILCCYMPEKTVQIGDHVVIFGKAAQIATKGYDVRAGETTTCLAYIDGCYGYVEPLSKQPKSESTGLSSNKNRDAPTRVAKQSPISRKDFLTFANHAQEYASCFKKSFFPHVHLDRIHRKTLKLVREIRLHSAEVHYAILHLSKAAKTKIHRLLAFYFIFCSSRHLPREDFPYLPGSIERHRKVFTGHLFEIESSIKTIYDELDFAVFPNPHPHYALQKSPRRMDLTLQHVQDFAEWFIAGGNFEIDSKDRWCKQTYYTLVHPYIVRMRLMKIWLRHLWLSETGRSSLSLVDSLLDVPTCYLVLVRNWLVLCADQMNLPLNLLNAVRKIRHESFNQSLLRYNEFCRSLWHGLDHMKPCNPHSTIAAIMTHWKHLDTLYQFRRPGLSMDLNSAGHKIAIKTTSMGRKMECAELTKQEEEAQKGDLPDLGIAPKDGIEDLVMDPSTPVNDPPSRKIFTDEAAANRTEPLAGHQQVCLKSRKKERDRISNREQDEISTPTKRVFIKKHLINDNGHLTLLASLNQARSSSGTTTEHAEDIETPVKVHLHRSARHFKKCLAFDKRDDHSDAPLPSHMSEELDPVQRENIESAMQEAPVGQPIRIRKHRVRKDFFRKHVATYRWRDYLDVTLPSHILEELDQVQRENIESAMQEAPVSQPIRIRKQRIRKKHIRKLCVRKHLATGEWNDHLDVALPSHMLEELDQIQRGNIESAMQEAPVGQQTPGQAVLEDIAFRQHRKMQELGRNQNMERGVEGVMSQLQDFFQREFGTAAVFREKIDFSQPERMPNPGRKNAMECDIEDVLAQIQDYFQQRSGTAAT